MLCTISKDMEMYFSVWQEVPTDLKSTQIENFVRAYLDLSTFTLKDTGYCDNAYGLEQILGWITNDENLMNTISLCETKLLYTDAWEKFVYNSIHKLKDKN